MTRYFFNTFVLLHLTSNIAYAKGGSSETSLLGVAFFIIYIIIAVISSEKNPKQHGWEKWFMVIVASPVILVVSLMSLYDYIKEKYQSKGK